MARALLERDGEISTIHAAARAAADGAGRFLLIEGAAGIGKTSLLEAAADNEAAFSVVVARAGELERALPFGVVRQLLERRASRDPDLLTGAAARAMSTLTDAVEDVPGDLFPILHGLYWLCSNLADRSPLLVAVDDLHWADEPSLHFVHYLARRLVDMPVLMLATVRAHDGDAPQSLLDGLRAEASEILRPQTLTLAATRSLLGDVDDAAAGAAHEATGGNPLLLAELSRSLAAGRPLAAAPRGVTERLHRTLARLTEDARALAGAVAVVGTAVEPHLAGTVAGLDDAAVLAAVDALTAAEVLDEGMPLRFLHPLIRTAMHESIPTGRRAALHRAAARALDADPPSVDEVATHLLQTPPAADAWAADRLSRAATSALARGAPGAAVRYAERALAEAPSGGTRFAVLSTLGQAEVRLGRMAAIEHLREAMSLTHDAERRVLVVRDVALQFAHAGQIAQARAVLSEALDELAATDRELRLWIEGDLVAYEVLDPAFVSEARARLADLAPALGGHTAAERYVLATYAQLQPTAAAAARFGELALAHHEDLEQRIPDTDGLGRPRRIFGAGWAVLALTWAQQLDRAEFHLDAQIRLQEHFSNLAPLAIDLMLRSVLNWQRGSVAAWEDDARRSIETSLLAGSSMALPNAVFMTTLALTERGALDQAVQELERYGLAGPLPDTPVILWLQWARGRLRWARREVEPALADLRAAADRDAGPWEGKTTFVLADLATTLAALGRHEEARETVEQAIADADRWGTSLSNGVALRAKGLTDTGESAIRTLRDAIDILAASPSRLEHARALVEFGSMLRRANRRSEARAPLREGMDHAVRCGAEALTERARRELLATGARPRRLILSGTDALTPTERHVAELAAEGVGNREIAQTLFVSHRTVEMHLSRAYRKLGITSRADLAHVLSRAQR